MSRSSRVRRAARVRARHHRGPTPPSEDHPGRRPGSARGGNPFLRPDPDVDQGIDQLLEKLIRSGAGPSDLLAEQVKRQILGRDDRAMRLIDQRLTLRLMAVLASLWERGWQPADLLHVVRRSDSQIARLLAAAITEQARRSRAEERAPAAWRSQLAGAAEEAHRTGLSKAGDGSEWRAAETQLRAGALPVQAWVTLLALAAQLDRLPPLERLVEPPSAWSLTRRRAAAPATGSDRSKLYDRVRALLAKAEKTEFAAEAEAFTAKAQDLMTRHAIDEALLHAHDEAPVAVSGARIHLHSPYTGEKVQLLNAVGAANRCRTIYLEHVAMATAVGTPVDLDQVELLFTSLLIQAVRAMTEAGAVRPGTFDRSASFRRSFLVSYAYRIGERLQEADDQAVRSYGAELVPVLSRQTEAVDAEFERLFPHTRNKQPTRYSARGWAAGRAAADQAVFLAGRLAPPSEPHGARRT